MKKTIVIAIMVLGLVGCGPDPVITNDQYLDSLESHFDRVSQVIRDMVESSNAKVEFLLEMTDAVDKGKAIRENGEFMVVFYIDDSLFERYQMLNEKHFWIGGLNGVGILPMSEYKGEKGIPK